MGVDFLERGAASTAPRLNLESMDPPSPSTTSDVMPDKFEAVRPRKLGIVASFSGVLIIGGVLSVIIYLFRSAQNGYGRSAPLLDSF